MNLILNKFLAIFTNFESNMKYLILSDIHGSLPQLDKVIDHFNSIHMDMLIILGDILNYGPRNGVPEGLNTTGIVDRLNKLKDRIICVRGNCDSEVDQMLLEFPIMSDYTIVVDNGKKLFLTHGHNYNEDNVPSTAYDAIVYGHTHVYKLENKNGRIICNTGSITFPKEGNPPTFATYSDGLFKILDLQGQTITELEIS